MKKLLIIVGIALLFTSCADNKTINGIEYRPYGLLNEETAKNDSVQYQVAWDAVVCGVIFFELIVPPIYVFGFNMYEPVGLKKDYRENNLKGVVK